MISKGTPHNNGVKLARYMTTGKEGERAELWELFGFASDDITDAFRDVHIMAEATRCQKPFFHVQVRNPAGETMPREDWRRAADRIESILGLKGQPRAISFHMDEKTGDEHMHVAWSRIDEDTLKAKPLPFYKLRLKRVSRELEAELGLTVVANEREGVIDYAPTRSEDEQARRLGVNIHDTRNAIRDCYDRSDCGRSFDDALAQEGLILAQGERRDYVVIDPAGGMHALGKRILGVPAGQIRDKLADLDRQHLPTVEQARELMLDLPHDRLDRLKREVAELEKLIAAEQEYARRDPVREEMAWLDAVAEAAIEKEKIEGRLIAAEDREKAGGGEGRREEKQERQPKPPAPELGRTAGEIRLAYSLTGTGQEFADALEDRGLILVRMAEADAARLNKWERQRLKELEALLPTPDQQQQAPGKPQPLQPERSLFHQAANEITREARPDDRTAKQQAEARKPHELTSADTWMTQTGGVDNLTHELLDAAQASYDKWTGPKEKYGLADYVGYVQAREAERRNQEPEQAPLYEKYKAGELVVVDQWSGVHQLNYRNTGDTLKDRENHLQDIALAPLFNVTDAEIVMKNLSAHRQEERRQLWEQKREETLRAAQEKHWPTLPPQPERQSPDLFHQAANEATRDDRTENLTGPAAQVWEAWRQTGSDQARAAELAALYGNKSVSLRSPTKEEFAAALDHKGMTFGRASKEEADRSHEKAAFARAAGNYAPRFKEGEIVLVIEARPEWNAEPRRRVYKLDQTIAEKFVTRLDIGNRLQSIEATLKASDERQQQRREERTEERNERATDLNDNRVARRAVRDVISVVTNTGEGILDKGKTAARAIGGALNIGAELSGLLFSALDTPKSPRQQQRDNREGERATDRRNAEADVQIDFSKYTSDRAQERRNEQGEQAARDRQREIERDR